MSGAKNTISNLGKILSIALLLTAHMNLFGQSAVQVKIRHIEEDGPTISRHIYGHFAEHLGRCIYDGFYVGDSINIPNTRGVRNDIIKALKEINIPNLRWPGGCFADTYHWKDGIGPKNNRPEIVNRWWGGITEDNSFGTHDFLDMCELLETEAYLSANVGSGTVQELVDWIQYVNFEQGTCPMADLRADNGRMNPWDVKYWGVGNEAWGCGGNMTPEYYANVFRKNSTFMSGSHNGRKLYRIASGASSDDYRWTEVLMRDIPSHLIEAIALHHYSVIDWSEKGSSLNFTEKQYAQTMAEAYKMEELITKHVEIMDKYDKKGEIDLLVDEWGAWYDVVEGSNPAFLFQQNTMRDAVLAGMTLNIFNNHAERVKMANIAQAVNVLQAVILTEETKLVLTPTYHVMNMYKVHQDAKLLEVDFLPPTYIYDDIEIPAISISASSDSLGTTNISIVNIDSKRSHQIILDMDDIEYTNLSSTVLTSDQIQNYNSFENPDLITPSVVENVDLLDSQISMEIPPFSVAVIRLK